MATRSFCMSRLWQKEGPSVMMPQRGNPMHKRHSWIVCLLALSVAANAADKKQPTVNADRIQQHITELAKFGTNPEGGVSRVAFSDFDIAARKYIGRLMQDADLRIRTDPAGNIIGRREGSNSNLPPIMIGSHIDSVPGGGNYDGDVGVIGAIEVAQTLKERGVRLKHPL